MEVINKRRSVRQFLDKKIENEKTELLLKAGMQAPSAGNQQPWEFVVISEKDTIKAMSKMSPYAGSAANAPLLIVVCGNTQRMRFPENMQQDLGACTENILLEAVELDLGTVWMSIYPGEERIENVREILGLPEEVIPYSLIVVGYPINENANNYVNRFDESRIHYEKY